MAKNYLYTFTIMNDRKGEIVDVFTLDEVYRKHHHYVKHYLAPAVHEAQCGWDDLQYICVKYPNNDHVYPYMVLFVDGKPERWIPVEGNSDGCNLQVIGENLW